MGPFLELIFKDDHSLIATEQCVFCVIQISRLQANPQKLQNYFTLNISQYMVVVIIVVVTATLESINFITRPFELNIVAF